jgi:hypothetical protein
LELTRLSEIYRDDKEGIVPIWKMAAEIPAASNINASQWNILFDDLPAAVKRFLDIFANWYGGFRDRVADSSLNIVRKYRCQKSLRK